MINFGSLDTTYMMQMHDGDGWDFHSQAEYDTADAVHELAAEMYGGLRPDQYRVIEVSRRVIASDPR